jgi:tetrahydromethanopterin S-methyltransferase subunit B
MHDDCPVDDASRRALRDLARRAEWRGQAGAAGAAQDAGTLRELGAELRAALARVRERDGASSAWSQQSIERLAAYCLKARADWTPEQIAELARLREDAVIALAPGPGESDALPPREGRAALANLGSRQARFVALTVVGCVLLAALVLLLPHFLSSDSPAQSASATTSAAPLTSTTAAAATDSAAPTASSASSSSSPTTAASTSSSPSTVAASSSSRVTAIQITNTDNVTGNPPEVILTYSITASGTGDVLIDITVNGSIPTQLASMEPIDESGQTSYSDLTQTISLSQWCGQTVKVAVSSGSVSQSVNVPVSC